MGAFDSSTLLGMYGEGGIWHMGDREMFFLRNDSGVLRTICDTWNTCVVPVFSGAHPGFKPDPGKPLAEAIIDLLLTRGRIVVTSRWCRRSPSPAPKISPESTPSRNSGSLLPTKHLQFAKRRAMSFPYGSSPALYPLETDCPFRLKPQTPGFAGSPGIPCRSAAPCRGSAGTQDRKAP